MAETVVLLLSFFALVTTSQGQSCSKPVGGPNMSLKDEYILQDTFADQTKVSFACNSGYSPAGGSPSITCKAGTWTDLTMTCQKKSCGALEDVANGQIHYPEGVDFGDKAVITCNPGYRLVGRNEIHCMDQGWDGRLPTCDAVKCVTPPDVEQATFYPVKDAYNYGEVVTYRCASGLTDVGSVKLTCADEGKFDSPPPKCIMVECEDPIQGLLEFVDGSRPPHKFQSTVIVKCSRGYTLIGQSNTLTCSKESKWSPEIPTCKSTLSTPRTTTTTTTTTTTSTHTPRASVTPRTSDPRDGGHGLAIGVGVAAVLAVVLAGGLAYYCRVLKKKSAWRTNTDKETAKEEENVRLS